MIVCKGSECCFRLLYWTDWGVKPSISVMDVVSGRKWVLVSTGLTLPNALVIDFTGYFRTT